MSRIGKSPIELPKGVEITLTAENVVKVKGPKGLLEQKVDHRINVSIDNGVVTFKRNSDAPEERSMHGLYRALVASMVEGVSKGYSKEMELVGVGYRVKQAGQQLELALGYSHPIILELPKEITASTRQNKGENPHIILESHDKQLLGMVASKIRSFRKPEPYKGKGVRFKTEYIRRKAGKSAGKK
jgi:large subunit ribosomal protein L6